MPSRQVALCKLANWCHMPTTQAALQQIWSTWACKSLTDDVMPHELLSLTPPAGANKPHCTWAGVKHSGDHRHDIHDDRCQLCQSLAARCKLRWWQRCQDLLVAWSRHAAELPVHACQGCLKETCFKCKLALQIICTQHTRRQADRRCHSGFRHHHATLLAS